MATSPATHLIERFYYEVWNSASERVAREILDPNFRFRASLGPEKVTPEGFIEYLRLIHSALGNYTTEIEEIVQAGARAAVRLSFKGTHRGPFFGVAATGREISWPGAAFFTVSDTHILSLWVLGDVDAVKRQLGIDSSNADGP